MNKRFIEFGGNYININNIEVIYKINSNMYSIFIKTITNTKFGEHYSTKEERDKRFDDVIFTLNK